MCTVGARYGQSTALTTHCLIHTPAYYRVMGLLTIHTVASGRTGRAGKKGTCITFFSRKDEFKIAKIEHDTSTKIARIGAPQVRIISLLVLKAQWRRVGTCY
jgi:hypothetical protein